MKALYFLISTLLIVLLATTLSARQEKLPSPVSQEDQIAEEKYQKAQQLFEQYRLSRPISEEMAEEIFGFYSRIDPDVVKDMKVLEKDNPKIYQDRLHHMEKEMRYLSRLREGDPEQFEKSIQLRRLEGECNKLAKQFRKTKDAAQKNQIEDQLGDLLNELFEMKEEEKKIEIDRILERVDKMRQEMEERKANKDNIIKIRLNQLLGKEHLSQW
jgi:hypothetical protein